jgi:hypothetical protein
LRHGAGKPELLETSEGELVILNMLVAAQEAGTAKEAVEYAAREASAPGLERFAGGDTIVISGLVVIILIVILFWWLLVDHGHH